MRYYVIINGVNSLTIEGLAIRTLPPISKPAMRNLREEIDGRDGDITTELGYGAYDKTLEIGLYGNYDINKIIAFFNSKGTIIFSDEPDKYYNFEIVDKIDYTKLVKFRTATINIHCQPFKYPVSEEPQVEEYEYVEATGTNVTLDNTSEAIFNKIDLLGNTSQTGTPTPSSPIPINVVSGDNYINICGKNLAKSFYTPSSTQVYIRNFFIDFDIQPDTTYTFSFETNQSGDAFYWNEAIFTTSMSFNSSSTGRTSFTATTKSDLSGLSGYDNTANGYAILKNYRTLDTTPTFNNVQVELGSTATTYEPYIGNSYPLYLGVENLFELPSEGITSGIAYSINDDNTINLSGTATANATFILYKDLADSKIINGDTYTFFANKTLPSGVEIRLEAYNGTTWLRHILNSTLSSTTQKITGSANTTSATRVRYHIYIASGTSVNISNLGIQLEKGNKQNSFTPYGTTPIEMASIPNTNYKDTFVKDRETWYKRAMLGKIQVTSSMIVQSYNPLTISKEVRINKAPINARVGLGFPIGYSNRYNYVNNTWGDDRVGLMTNAGQTGTQISFRIPVSESATYLDTHETWLLYELEEAEDIEITNETLIDQLEAIKNAISYKGQTNITQTNNDLPFILDLSALELGSDHLVINNQGNIYSKPTLDLEGSGIVDIYLNDNQILEADLTEAGEIVIDTEAMEATNPSTGLLANRQVTGDYSRIKLEPGENDLRFSGDLSKATVTKYKRWL